MRASKLLVIVASLFLTSILGTQGQTVTRELARPTVTVPPLITFGGVLKGRSGQPMTGVVGLTFSLYKDQEGGAPIWTENQNVQLDSEGRYSTLLGATQASGLPMDLFASGQSRWLGVQAQLPGEEEQPRVLLVSVPYALKAADADTIGGKPFSAFVLAGPENELALSGNNPISGPRRTGITPKFTGAGTGTSTPNATVRWSDTIGTLGNGSIQDNGSGVAMTISGADYVGIGTTAPVAPLNVAGNPGIIAIETTNNANNPYFSFNGAGGGTVGQLYSDMFTNNFVFQTNNGSGLIPGLTITGLTNPGSVGIGTTSPVDRLDVNGNIGTFGGGQIRFYRQNNTNWSFIKNSGGLTGNDLGFYVSGNNPDLYVNLAGSVGIGTSSPAAKLDVVGGVNASGNINASGALCINGTCQTSWPAGTITGVTAGTGLTGGGTNGSVALNVANGGIGTAQLAAAAKTRSITYLAGCDSCSALASTDSQHMIYINLLGSMTINSVSCYSDAGSPVINIARNGAHILGSGSTGANLTCSSTGVSSSILTAQNTLNLNDTMDFVMVTPDGVAKRITVVILATLN